MMKLILNLFLFLLLNNLQNTFSYNVQEDLINKNDSLKTWVNIGKNETFSDDVRKKHLHKAYNHIINNNIQTPLDLSTIAYQFYKLKDSINFFAVNKIALEHSKKYNDIYVIGDVNWNYAFYYSNIHIAYDKAYDYFNKAYDAFNKGNYKYETAKILISMSNIKGLYKDCTGAEVLNFKAIKLFKELKDYQNLYTSYNHLAQLQKDIKEYDKALYYYDITLTYEKYIKKSKINLIHNNIGNIFVKKKQYKKALSYYKKDLIKKKISATQQAILMDNIAYCKLLMNDTIGIKKDFYKALYIRDSIGNKEGILTSKIRLSDFYLYAKDTLNALKYAQESNSLAKKIKNGVDYLTTLQQLANLDTKNQKKYLDRYIEFNDSLIITERRTLNKFTRIEFETDEYIKENKRLGTQRLWLFIGGLGLLLIVSLLYFIRIQKIRNEKLKLEAEQQKANEEVYILTLQQQAKLEEERIKERNRISAELHDGILGNLFGTRVSLGFLGMQMTNDTKEKHQTFLNELQHIEKEIRDVSHRLSENFDDASINFTTIITELLEKTSSIGHFKYQSSFDDTIAWNSLNEVTKANIYRIIQEALQNIIKHANAKNITLDIQKSNNQLIIIIKDDGVGFNVKKSKKGIGVKNITSRVKMLKGTLHIDSEVNKGTTLTIKTPFTTPYES